MGHSVVWLLNEVPVAVHVIMLNRLMKTVQLMTGFDRITGDNEHLTMVTLSLNDLVTIRPMIFNTPQTFNLSEIVILINNVS